MLYLDYCEGDIVISVRRQHKKFLFDYTIDIIGKNKSIRTEGWGSKARAMLDLLTTLPQLFKEGYFK